MPKHVCTLAAAAVVMLVNSAAVSAHDFYDEKCCHDQDCRPVKCNEIMSFGSNKGWSWRKAFFPADRLHLSPDGNCHVCISAGVSPGICIYLPPGI